MTGAEENNFRYKLFYSTVDKKNLTNACALYYCKHLFFSKDHLTRNYIVYFFTDNHQSNSF